MVEEGDKKIIEKYFEEREKCRGFLDKLYVFLSNLLPDIKISIFEKDKKELTKILEEIHLDTSPEKILLVQLFSFFVLIIFCLFTIFLPVAFEIKLIIIFFAFFFFYIFLSHPYDIYLKTRRIKENQFPLAIFYIASYMRVESNLENAVRFTVHYLPNPLKLDFLRILWEVETEKYPSMIEAIDKYLSRWIDDAPYFVEAFELIISTLYEVNPLRKDIIFDRAMETFANGVQIKMQSYIRNIKGPIEAVYMMGLVLPLLTISLLPLLSAFLTEIFTPLFLFSIYDLIIPTISFFLGYKYLSNRPGFSLYEDEIIRESLRRKKAYKVMISILFGGLSFLIFSTLLSFVFPFMLEYHLVPLLYSVLVIFIFGVSISIAFLQFYRSFEKIRKKIARIVNEIPFAIYHLANRMNEGVSPEKAFYSVYEYLRDKEIGEFSYLVSRNVVMGKDLYLAIFDPKDGAITKYPSSLLKSIMHILVESSKKGVETAAKTLSYIFQYLIKLKQVDERLKDLLADVTSSMKVLISFMAPVMVGLIVGLTIMLIGVLAGFSKIYSYLESMQGLAQVSGFIPLSILEFFSIKKVIPPMIVQFIVGLYLIELVGILAFFLNRIENGYDEIEEKKYIGESIFKAVLLYSIVCGTSSVFLWNLAMLIYKLV